MDSSIDKYIHILISIIISGIIFYFSEFELTYKVVFIILTFFLNKYFTTSLYRNIKNRLKLITLEDLEYFSINPKVEFFIHIITAVFGYGLWTYAGLGKYEMSFGLHNPLVLLGIFFLFYFIFLRAYGPAAQITISTTNIILTLKSTSLSGYAKRGRRFGSYSDGVIVDKYIFPFNTIYHLEESDNEKRKLIFHAGENYIVNIYDPVAIAYFLEIF